MWSRLLEGLELGNSPVACPRRLRWREAALPRTANGTRVLEQVQAVRGLWVVVGDSSLEDSLATHRHLQNWSVSGQALARC